MDEFEKAFEEAMDVLNDKDNHTEEEIKAAKLIVLQDAYSFLESENFHLALSVIEELTGIPYE